MSYKPIRMDIVKRILELKMEGFSIKKTSRTLGVSKNTVRKYLRRYEEGTKLLVENQQVICSQESLTKLFDQTVSKEELDKQDSLASKLPHYLKELKRVGVTRMLLWEEYRKSELHGYSYSRFCHRLKMYKKMQEVTLRLDHKNGHALTIDYAGKKLSYIEKRTGEIIYCEVLVCTLPASGYTFACALRSQKQEDFVDGINQALRFIGGLPKVILSDNLKSFVIKADRYEPSFNQLSLQLATHYGVDLQATRSGKPKDKAHVERHVAIVYNQVYGPLRNEEFYSLEELNKAIIKRVGLLNEKHYQGKSYSRASLFAEEKEALSALPCEMFERKKSTKAKVQRNYHVIVGEDKHQYSVPYQHVGKTTDIIYTSNYVEVYLNQTRIALHKRDRRKHGYTTSADHMPEKHLKYLERKGWDAAYFKKMAKRNGPHTLWAISEMLESKVFIEQTYNACLGVLSLIKKYSPQRVEVACLKARETSKVSYQVLANILKNNMDKIVRENLLSDFTIQQHDNLRGAQAFNDQ